MSRLRWLQISPSVSPGTLVSLLILISALFPRAAAAEDTTAIADLVARFHAEHRFDGAVLVARGDEVIYEGGFGEADRAWHVPNRPDTVFLVGSISKQFTAMLILQLAADGKLGLTDPLSKYLPDYPPDKAGITLHQLLCHASGLPHYDGFEEIGVDLDDYLRLFRPVKDYVELIGKLKLQSEPGTEHSYSSMGYIVLAYVAELVSGKDYGRLIEERIARPIGAEDLGFAYGDRLVERLAPGYVYEIRRRDGGGLELGHFPEPYRDQSNKYSTGGVHASVRSLFRWARALVGDKLLEPSWRDRMFTPQADNYGYGWRIETGEPIGLPDEVEVISHLGSLSGYRGSIMLLDRGRYTLIALANSDVSRSDAVTEDIALLLHGRDPGPVNNLGTAVAWRMVRDGPEVATEFFRKQQAAGFRDYIAIEATFSAFVEELTAKNRPDYGLRLAELGLEAHPGSAMIQLALAVSQRALGDSVAARAAARKALALAAEGAGAVEERAKKLLAELAAEEVPLVP